MNDQDLRIAIADDNEDHALLLQRSLTNVGHQVVASCRSGQKLVEFCRDETPDLVITDIKMPDMDGLEAASRISSAHPVPIIVVTSHLDQEYVRRAKEEQILGFLVKPIAEQDLVPAIAIVMQRFEEFATLRRENSTLQKALEDRKLIERAKGILMKQAAIDEEQAFKRLQKLARDKRQKLADIASAIITAEEALQ